MAGDTQSYPTPTDTTRRVARREEDRTKRSERRRNRNREDACGARQFKKAQELKTG